MLEKLISLLSLTLMQLAGLFGVFFIIGFLLYMLQRSTHRMYRSISGWQGILWTAWIGTPIHEMGHVVFAKIFRHTISDVSLFKPNATTGGLGHVSHTYNKHSLYQQIGNFFIGAAPLICGGISIALLLFVLVPNSSDVFAPLLAIQILSDILPGLSTSTQALFSHSNIIRWDFWIFLYVSFAITSHMAPSKQDQHGMWKGFVWLTLLLFAVNLVLSFFGLDAGMLIRVMQQIVSIATAIGLYALMLALLHWLCIGLVHRLFQKMHYT